MRHSAPPSDPLAGVAAARGLLWAERVATAFGWELRSGRPVRRGRQLEPWPPFGDKAAVIARRLVHGLTGDAVIAERLAGECHTSAARWWDLLRA